MADFRTSSEKNIADMSKSIEGFRYSLKAKKQALSTLHADIHLTMLNLLYQYLKSSPSYKKTWLLRIKSWMCWRRKQRKQKFSTKNLIMLQLILPSLKRRNFQLNPEMLHSLTQCASLPQKSSNLCLHFSIKSSVFQEAGFL